MTFDEIAAFLAENKDSSEISKIAAMFPARVDADAVKAWIESPDGEKLVKSGTVKSVEAHVRSILERQAEKRAAELNEANNAKLTVEEKVAALEKELREGREKAARAEWKSKAYQLAATKGVPVEFVDNYGGDPEAIESFLDMVNLHNQKIRTEVEKKAFADGFKPGGASKPGSSDVDYKSMSPAERLAKAKAEAAKRMGGGDNGGQ